MSGHAAIALVLLRDRGQFATQLPASSENPFHRVKGNLRFPLTFTYHGCPSSLWMPKAISSHLPVPETPSGLFNPYTSQMDTYTHGGKAPVQLYFSSHKFRACPKYLVID